MSGSNAVLVSIYIYSAYNGYFMQRVDSFDFRT